MVLSPWGLRVDEVMERGRKLTVKLCTDSHAERRGTARCRRFLQPLTSSCMVIVEEWLQARVGSAVGG